MGKGIKKEKGWEHGILIGSRKLIKRISSIEGVIKVRPTYSTEYRWASKRRISISYDSKLHFLRLKIGLPSGFQYVSVRSKKEQIPSIIQKIEEMFKEEGFDVR